LKKGFSLIEVVFAIVIISISLMSVPMLLKQSSKSDEFSIMQEAILATSTKMGNILSYPWDSRSYDSTNAILRTLDIHNGDSELNRVTGSRDSNLRRGHIYQDKRRKFFDFTSVGRVYPNHSIGATANSINYFHGKSVSIGGSDAYDYKDANMNMASSVFYVSDVANYSQRHIVSSVNTTTINNIMGVRDTNIKMVQITTNSPKLNHNLTLRCYTCNIGQSKLLTRTK